MPSRGRLGALWGPSWPSRGRFGALFGPSWTHFGALLGPSWGPLGGLLGPSEASKHCNVIFAHVGCPQGTLLEPFWVHFWTHFGTIFRSNLKMKTAFFFYIKYWLNFTLLHLFLQECAYQKQQFHSRGSSILRFSKNSSSVLSWPSWPPPETPKMSILGPQNAPK